MRKAMAKKKSARAKKKKPEAFPYTCTYLWDEKGTILFTPEYGISVEKSSGGWWVSCVILPSHILKNGPHKSENKALSVAEEIIDDLVELELFDEPEKVEEEEDDENDDENDEE
jgi:hypothetical protein